MSPSRTSKKGNARSDSVGANLRKFSNAHVGDGISAGSQMVRACYPKSELLLSFRS
jgi:hypothetical protein